MSLMMRIVHNLRAPALEEPVIAGPRETSRLILRPYTMDDVDDWAAIEQDASVREALGWPERTPAEVREHLRHRTRHTTLRHVGDLLVLAAEYQGRVIGDVSLHLRTTAPATRSVEVGWLVHSRFRGQGLATEAADAILDVAFEDAKATLVVAVLSNANERSAKLALRLGFRLAAYRGDFTTFVLSRDDYALRSDSAGEKGRPNARDAEDDPICEESAR
jgi:RimJ/RimL family protein N-acetyltransferase